MKNNIKELIFAYLKAYADVNRAPYPDPLPATIKALRQNPKQAFDIIADFRGPLPANLDFRDADAPLCRLLSIIADLVPELLIPRMTTGYWASRYLFVSAAAGSKSPKFIPTIIELLTDRSIYIKTLVLQLIIDLPHLQVPEANPKLEKLGKMKSIQQSAMDSELLDRAKAILQENIKT